MDRAVRCPHARSLSGHRLYGRGASPRDRSVETIRVRELVG